MQFQMKKCSDVNRYHPHFSSCLLYSHFLRVLFLHPNAPDLADDISDDLDDGVSATDDDQPVGAAGDNAENGVARTRRRRFAEKPRALRNYVRVEVS